MWSSPRPVQTLRVDGKAGNNTLNGVFDAPLGERITATSSAVTCDIQVDAPTAVTSPVVAPYP